MGTLLLTDAFDSSVVIWQSFNHLTNTWLPGAVRYNNRTKRKTSSWNPEKPGKSCTWSFFFFELDELPFNLSNYLGTFTKATLEINGQLKFYAWYQDCRTWKLISTEPSNQWEVNVSCGTFSICDQRWYPHYRCLEGFEPKVRGNWRLKEFSDGCVRKIPFHCSPGDSFLVITDVAYPQNFKEIFHVSIDQCRLECLINFSCIAIAYTFSDSRRCYMWTRDLYNIRTTPYGFDFISYSPNNT
ncbi:hypothetical protein ACFX2H_013803 [Malus domestica]